MKKSLIALVVILGVVSIARADEIQLAGIDTDNCAAAQSEIRLLNGNGVTVSAVCQEGSFVANNGRVYSERLETSVIVPYSVSPGQSITLASIDTNNCSAAQSEVKLLNSAQFSVISECEAGSFAGKNGQVYAYRLNTAVNINY